MLKFNMIPGMCFYSALFILLLNSIIIIFTDYSKLVIHLWLLI